VAHYAGALLYLVPVVVAGIVAFVVSRPDKAEKDEAARDEAAKARAAAAELVAQQAATKPVPPQRRAKDNVVAHPTLMHAALSTHLTAVSGTRVHAGKHRTGSAQAASLAAGVSAQHAAARLVSIRKPARIPRRPVHRCPHKP
jgi:hypothetical protein